MNSFRLISEMSDAEVEPPPEEIESLLEKRLKKISKKLFDKVTKGRKRSKSFREKKSSQMKAYHQRKRQLESDFVAVSEELRHVREELQKREEQIADLMKPREAPPEKKRDFGFSEIFQRPYDTEDSTVASCRPGSFFLS